MRVLALLVALLALGLPLSSHALCTRASSVNGTDLQLLSLKFVHTVGTAGTITDYEDRTYEVLFTQNATTAVQPFSDVTSAPFEFVRLNKQVTLQWPAILGTVASGQFNITFGVLPARLRPAYAIDQVVRLKDSVPELGNVQITTAGLLIFYRTNGAGLTAGASRGILGGATTYLAA